MGVDRAGDFWCDGQVFLGFVPGIVEAGDGFSSLVKDKGFWQGRAVGQPGKFVLRELIKAFDAIELQRGFLIQDIGIKSRSSLGLSGIFSTGFDAAELAPWWQLAHVVQHPINVLQGRIAIGAWWDIATRAQRNGTVTASRG